MKRLCLIALLLFIGTVPAGLAQTTVELGELPKSEYVITIYQVYGFHEGPEGFKITYLDTNNEPKNLFLPIEMRSSYRILRPQFATAAQNFLIVWKKGEKVERVEWFMPTVVDYHLPNFINGPFNEEDRRMFRQIVQSGELTLEAGAAGIEPIITAPGGGR